MMKIKITQKAVFYVEDHEGVDWAAIVQAAEAQAHELVSWHAPVVEAQLWDPDAAPTHELAGGVLRKLPLRLLSVPAAVAPEAPETIVLACDKPASTMRQCGACLAGKPKGHPAHEPYAFGVQCDFEIPF